jgi:phage gp29-like protein
MQASRTDAYAVFDKMAERCNSEISKIILGQTGTTDEKSYSGSANVHEGVAAMIAKQDTLKMQFIIEDQLVPMMIRNGFDLTGCTFKYDESESLPLAEQAKIDVDFLKAGIKLEHEYLEHKYGVEIMDELPEADEEEEVIKVENKLRNLYK